MKKIILIILTALLVMGCEVTKDEKKLKEVQKIKEPTEQPPSIGLLKAAKDVATTLAKKAMDAYDVALREYNEAIFNYGLEHDHTLNSGTYKRFSTIDLPNDQHTEARESFMFSYVLDITNFLNINQRQHKRKEAGETLTAFQEAQAQAHEDMINDATVKPKYDALNTAYEANKKAQENWKKANDAYLLRKETLDANK